MTKRWKFALLSLLVVLVALTVAPVARAEQWDKETVVTFSGPIEVPGKILPAGTYVFKLANNQSDRQIVQIFTKDHRNLLATIQAIPDYHLAPTEKPVISFAERPSGRPEAVQSWFYPGDNYGIKFVYPKSTSETAANPQELANAQPTTAAAVPAEATVPPVHASDAEAVAAMQEQEPQIIAQETPVQPREILPASLPQTAGNFIALPLIGLALWGGGLTMLHKARQKNYRE
jgi:hypothetical protein